MRTRDGGDVHEAAAERWRKRWVEERLKEIGLERARRWGWPNTYSYSKSLGEQLVFAAQDTIAATVARPSIIESALRDPFPGWNQGVNTSAPLTYLSGRGYRFYPAKGELVLDVIPVDLAAHAMIPILAALLAGRHKPIYQLCTSDVNPLPMRRLVELTGLSNRREHRRVGGPMGRFAPHLEAVVVSQNTYELASQTLPELLKQGRRRRPHAARRGFRAARKSSRRASTSSAPTRRWRASWSRSIAHTSRSWSTPSTAPTSARSTSRSRPPTPSIIPTRPSGSIGRTTGSTCICRDCAGTFSARSICIPAAAPALRRAIARWPKCWTAPPSATARGPRWSRGSPRANASRPPSASCATVRIAPACCSGCAGSRRAIACCSSARTRPSGCSRIFRFSPPARSPYRWTI